MYYICLVGINHTIWQEGSFSATIEKGIHCYALLSAEEATSWSSSY